MTDETIAPTPTPVWDGDPSVQITIPTTDTLTQERLEEIAAQTLLAYEPIAGGGGITVVCHDQKEADFWNRRGAFWAEQAAIRA